MSTGTSDITVKPVEAQQAQTRLLEGTWHEWLWIAQIKGPWEIVWQALA